MECKEDIWGCPEKPIPIESDSSKDSDDSTNSSDSTGSPPLKRRRFLRLIDFTPVDIENLKSVAADVLELKDYAEWFLSRSKTNVDDILDPKNYCEWVSTLGTEAKAKVMIQPAHYWMWYYYLVEKGIQPLRVGDIESMEQRNKRYGELALEHFNKTSNCSEDYEYTRGCEILEFDHFVHLNFYARLKVSESRREPGDGELFFAEVRTQNEAIICCILNSKEFANSPVRHPPGFNCLECEYDDGLCCCGCAYDD